jgi:hypothetical protein
MQAGTTQSTTELIVDGGFESATATGNSAPGWNVWPYASHSLIISGGAFPYTGANYAYLGGSDNTNTDIIAQTVTIPSNASTATLTFWVNIVTQETNGFGAFDFLSVGLYNLDGSWITNLKNLTNEDAPSSNNTDGSYFKVGPLDVSAYKGSALQVAFVVSTDSSLPTTFRLDDVSLQVSTTTDNPPTTSITSPTNGATVSGTVTVNATSNDDNGVTTLEIDIDGSVKTSNSNSGSLAYSWNTTLFSNGQHTIVSKAGDAAGHVTTSSSVFVTVSNGILAAPANVVATALSPTQVGVSWSDVGGASSYQIFRNSGTSGYGLVGTSTNNNFVDSGLATNSAYLYEVRAVDASNNAGFLSTADLATTIVFTNDPLVAGSTVIKAVQLTELRIAVDAVRTAAGLASGMYTGSIAPGVVIRAVDLTELRSLLNEARSALGLPTLSFANTLTSTSSVIKAVDVSEIRNGVR